MRSSSALVLWFPATPEPSTWAMMALGFAGLGYAAFRRNSKGRALRDLIVFVSKF